MSLRQLWRVALLIIVGLTVAGCLSPDYTYVADSSDKAYFKVPPSWHQVSTRSLQAVQLQFIAQGVYVWTRAYEASASPSVGDVFLSSPDPVAYASVVDLSPAERDNVSYNIMRDWIWPVTPEQRSIAAANHALPPGFISIRDQTVTNSRHDRGVREVFGYKLGAVPEMFDLTVMTNTDTSKLYFLVVHCDIYCFNANFPEIEKVVGSFRVGGAS